MPVRDLVRARPIALFGLMVLAGCTYHSYGLTVEPMGSVWAAEKFLAGHGFAEAAYSAGDELSMERRRGDSVDHVRVFRGGGSPGVMSGATLAGSGNGVYARNGISQAAPVVSSGFYSPAVRGPSRLLTLEMTTYKVDAKGRRHEVEPTSAALDDLDSAIFRVAHR